MQSTLSIRANWIWTGVGEPQANGCITIQDDRIISVSTRAPASAIDLGAYCILPGLINSHTHFEFSDLRHPVSASGSFADWILNVIQRRRMVASEQSLPFRSPTDEGLVESRNYGVRLALDVVHTNIDEAAGVPLSSEQFEPNVCPSDHIPLPTTICFAELMATTDLRERQTWRGAIVRKRSNPKARSFGLSPHAPYTTTAKQVRQAVARCNRWKVPIMMHLAESMDEMRWIENGDGPLQDLIEMVAGPDVQSTKDRLSIAGYVSELCKAPASFIVHGNFLDNPAMAILEANRGHTAVVYCPRTHAHFRHSKHPLLELRSRGIPVVLGTDSRASNPDLSILDEARIVRQNFGEVSADEILSMITTRPADLLGRANDWGYVRPGCLGRLTVIPCYSSHSRHVLEELLESSHPSKPLEAALEVPC